MHLPSKQNDKGLNPFKCTDKYASVSDWLGNRFLPCAKKVRFLLDALVYSNTFKYLYLYLKFSSMEETLKSKIITLRRQKKSYKEILKTLNCALSTVSYHCKKENLNKPLPNLSKWNKGESLDKWRNTRKNNAKLAILRTPYNELSFERLRKRIIYEQDSKCNKCDLKEWQGKDIPLEIDHKDGDNQNNIRENLEALCPNCHALTPTWRGRNKSKRLKVSDEVLLSELISTNFNMRQALLKCGLAAKGGNYNRCHKLKREFEEYNMQDVA